MRSFLSIPVFDFLAPALARATPGARPVTSHHSRFASSSTEAFPRIRKPHDQSTNSKAGLLRLQASNGKPSKAPPVDPNIIEGIAVGPAREALRQQKVIRRSSEPFRDAPRSKPHQIKYGIPSLATPRRKGLQERPPPRSHDPIHILSQIRKAAETKPKGKESIPGAANSISQYDQAVRNVITRNAAGLLAYETAFVSGWRPIRLAGSAGNLKLEDILRVLDSVIVEMGREGSVVAWNEVKDLMLYLATKKGMRGLVEWCWSDISRGEAGAKRVVELYTSLMEGEHVTMKEKETKLSNEPFPTTQDSVEIPHRLFGAYVAARSILHPPAVPFIEVYRQFLNPFHPNMRRFEGATDFKTLTATGLDSYPLEISNRAKSWIRQISLAQLWSKQGGNGLEIARYANATLRKGDSAAVWALWEKIKEGYEKKENVNWIQDGWRASAEIHLIDGVVTADIGSVDSAPFANDAGPLTSFNEISSPSSLATVQPSDNSIPPPAILTQAIVACFLSAFARVKLFDQANSIWEWLSSQSLKPGLVLWCGLLSGYASAGNAVAAEIVFSDMKAAGVIPDTRAQMYLAQAYFVAQQPTEAMVIVNRMLENSKQKIEVEIYARIIGGLLSNGGIIDAQAVLDSMEERGVKPNTMIVNLFLKQYTFGSKPNLPAMVATLRLIDDHSLTPDVFTFTMVLQALLKLDQKGATQKLIRIMGAINIKPSITTYGTMINNLAAIGRMPELQAAVELLDDMERAGIITNEIIYTSLIQGFLRAISNNPMRLEADQIHPCFAAALSLQTRMEGKGIALNRVGLNAIISAALALRTNKGIELALAAFEILRVRGNYFKSSPDGVAESALQADTWYILLDGFLAMDDYSRARGVLAEMDRLGFIARSKSLKNLVDTVRRGGRRY